MSVTAPQSKSKEELEAIAAAALAADPAVVAAAAEAAAQEALEASAKAGNKDAIAALADKAVLAVAAAHEAAMAPGRPEYGAKVLVSGVIASQVNPLTNQVITHGLPVIAVYDRWVEIQLEAGVLARTSM